MSQGTLTTSALIYRAFVVFTVALVAWSIYVSIFGPYSAFNHLGWNSIFTEDFWQFQFGPLWHMSVHGMMLLAALIALVFRSGATVWLHALAVVFTVVPKAVLVLAYMDSFEVWGVLRLIYLLLHIALMAWTLRYLVLKQEIRSPL